MNAARRMYVVAAAVVALSLIGCTAKNVDFSDVERPARAAEMEAYSAFVGSWDWEAEMVNAAPADKSWKGTAQWNWTLDKRCLHGVMSASSANAEFEAAGVWSWHPTRKKYIWWMFNNWGYPQQGVAKYDSDSETWRMTYKSIGLDGTSSYGLYEVKVVDENTMDWTMLEWADALHSIKKMEMTGTYKRKG